MGYSRQELFEDSWSGKLSVRKAKQQFAVELEAFPIVLKGGGAVFFTVRAWNFEDQAVSLSGFVEDEDGAIVKSIDGFEGRVPANAQNYTLTAFSLDVYGVGNHTYRLFLDNYDGEANGKGEEHWSEVRVEVKPMNGTELKQVGFECDDIYFDFKDRAYNATLSCRVYLYNPSKKDALIKDITVLDDYSLGDLENVPAGDLSAGKWGIHPGSFILQPQETKAVQFSLPLTIGSWIPISGADVTEVVLKDGEYVTVKFNYTLGYTYDGNLWVHFTDGVYDIVQVKMDTKTVVADYMLSGGMAYISTWTLLKVPSEF